MAALFSRKKKLKNQKTEMKTNEMKNKWTSLKNILEAIRALNSWHDKMTVRKMDKY